MKPICSGSPLVSICRTQAGEISIIRHSHPNTHQKLPATVVYCSNSWSHLAQIILLFLFCVSSPLPLSFHSNRRQHFFHFCVWLIYTIAPLESNSLYQLSRRLVQRSCESAVSCRRISLDSSILVAIWKLAHSHCSHVVRFLLLREDFQVCCMLYFKRMALRPSCDALHRLGLDLMLMI